ncbi:MAG TPA: hypothetical protein VMZ03_05365 [Chitinophagaceae bacterium]|nr:hypothetical protein [Chitinophagaceae bacterium]
MKRIFILMGLVCSYFFSQAQLSTAATFTETNFTDDRVPGKIMFKKNGQYVKAYLNNVPSAVLADFTKRYEDPSIVSWVIDESDITGYFNLDKESVIVSYKKDGYLVSIRKTYDSTKLVKQVRDFLHDELKKGYLINLVTEIIINDGTLYEVTLLKQQQVFVITLSKKRNGDILVSDRLYYTQVAVKNI